MATLIRALVVATLTATLTTTNGIKLYSGYDLDVSEESGVSPSGVGVTYYRCVRVLMAILDTLTATSCMCTPGSALSLSALHLPQCTCTSCAPYRSFRHFYTQCTTCLLFTAPFGHSSCIVRHF
jgi:hypothetical protein